MLHDIYQAPLSKIDLIPHGIADVGFVDPTYFKDQFQVEGPDGAAYLRIAVAE